MIRVMRTGRNFTMRYLTRTHRLPIAWMHERFKQGDIVLRYEVSARMAADIYTKAFQDADKWRMACWLINVVDPVEMEHAAEFVLTEPDQEEWTPEGKAQSYGEGVVHDALPVKRKSAPLSKECRTS